jgi:hypothetical protein
LSTTIEFHFISRSFEPHTCPLCTRMKEFFLSIGKKKLAGSKRVRLYAPGMRAVSALTCFGFLTK